MISWIEGSLIYILLIIIIPLIIGIISVIIISKKEKDGFEGVIGGTIIFIVLCFVMIPASGVIWHNAFEIPSVQEKTITVQEWIPAPCTNMSNINNAEQLMLVTTEDEGFINKENLLFGKFNTRDLLFELKPGGTYVVKYYGWREGFNSGYPNLLEVVEVVDESNAKNMTNNDYFGIKLQGGGL